MKRTLSLLTSLLLVAAVTWGCETAVDSTAEGDALSVKPEKVKVDVCHNSPTVDEEACSVENKYFLISISPNAWENDNNDHRNNHYEPVACATEGEVDPADDFECAVVSEDGLSCECATLDVDGETCLDEEPIVCEKDSDGDGVYDSADICEGGDDNVDFDEDGTPDFCDDDDDDDGILDIDEIPGCELDPDLACGTI